MKSEPEQTAERSATENGGECSSRFSGKWPLEKVLFAMAGTMAILSAALAAFVSPWFLLLTVFVGLNQWIFVATGACPASLILSKAFGFRSASAGEGR
jgi:hypothetical protein